MKYLVLLDSFDNETVVSRVRKYDNNADALIAFSETPCMWSQLVDTEDEVKSLTSLTLSEVYEKFGDMM